MCIEEIDSIAFNTISFITYSSTKQQKTRQYVIMCNAAAREPAKNSRTHITVLAKAGDCSTFLCMWCKWYMEIICIQPI
jgi:hypothetical protein